MSYPTNSVALTVATVDRTAIDLKSLLQSFVAQMAAGSVPSSTILGIHARLKRDDATLAEAGSVAGIAAYAQTNKGNAQLDVAAEFNAMRTAIGADVSWIEANFPASGGYLQSHQFSGGQVVERQFNSASTAGLRTTLNAVIATIA